MKEFIVAIIIAVVFWNIVGPWEDARYERIKTEWNNTK